MFALLALFICSAGSQAQIQIVSSERVAGNQLRLVFTDTEGTRNYQLQSASQIEPAPAWQAVSGVTISPRTGGGFELLTTAPATGSAFYRITVSGDPNDPDGDGLLTTIENQGWTVVTTDASGAIHQETVTSDPNVKDTDSDGLEDNVERQMNLNPRLIDTDGDGLSDFEESRLYFTNPAAVDTDNDASGDPRFLDGSEVLTRGTSPNLADTDGDNRTDRGEYLQNGNALVSDLPRPFIDIDPNSVILTLNSTYTGTVTTNKSYTQTLGQTESNSLSRSDATSTQTSYEASASITAGVEATAGVPPGVTVSASATVGFSAGFVDQNTVTVGEESSKQSQQQYEHHQEDSATFGTETGSGRIALSLHVKNTGAVAFTLKNLTITAARRNPASPGSPQPVGTLQVDGLQDGVTIAPNESSGPLNAHFDSVTVDTMRDLLRDPTQLSFMVGNFDLVDAESRNFAFLRDTNSHVTAGLTIDFGNGVVNGETGRVDRYRVATNVKIDENGFPQGVTLKEVFEKYLRTTIEPGGVPYMLGTNSVSGKRVLTSIRGVATDPAIRHFWVVAGSRLSAITNANFDEIRLMPSDQLYIFYVTDEDNDKLTDREEFIYGTSDKSADTDGDEINDYDEVRTGWSVTVEGKPTRPVYSDPRLVDTDNDGRNDAQEKSAGTDPRLQDTDLDGLLDNVDPNPLVYTFVPPTITLDAPVVNQTAVSITFHATGKPAIVNVSVDWGDGTAATVVNSPGGSMTFESTVTHTYATGNTFPIVATVRDVNGQTATDSKNVTTVAFPTAGLIGEYLFTSGSTEDTSGNGKNGHLDRSPFVVPAPDQKDRNNMAYHFDPFANSSDGTPASIYIGNGSANTGWAYAGNFTIAAWINCDSGGGAYAIAGQDRSPILYLDNSQNLAFGIPNDTPVAKDNGNIPSGVWTHVAVTVEKGSSATTYTLYKKGVKVDQKSSSVVFDYPNTSMSRIGIYSYSNNNPEYTTNFRGSIDSVRVYNRALRPDEIEALAKDTE